MRSCRREHCFQARQEVALPFAAAEPDEYFLDQLVVQNVSRRAEPAGFGKANVADEFLRYAVCKPQPMRQQQGIDREQQIASGVYWSGEIRMPPHERGKETLQQRLHAQQ